MQYNACYCSMMHVNAVCYLRGGCYYSMLLAWWMLMQYDGCYCRMVHVNAVCYLHDAYYCSMLLAWWMLVQCVTCMMQLQQYVIWRKLLLA